MELAKERSGLKSLFKKLRSQFNSSLKSQKTYIVPTKLGLSYGVLCFILLLIAMSYGNNLVYIVCFALTCMGMNLARAINSNMESVQILGVEANHLFAEKDQKIQVTLTNPSKEPLREVELRTKQKNSNPTALITLGPKQMLVVDVPWDVPVRGLVEIPTVIISSRFPSGLFHSWKILKSNSKALIYPCRKGQTQFPNHVSTQQDALGLIREIRDYKPGDSPKRIHWRSLAKSQHMRTLVHEGEDGRKCEFSLRDLSNLSFEDQISQLSLWLHLAESESFDWKLNLNEQVFDKKIDPHIYHRAMETLSLMVEKK